MRIKERDLDSKLAYAQKKVVAAVNDPIKLSLVIRSIYLAGLLDGRCFTPKSDAGLVEALKNIVEADDSCDCDQKCNCGPVKIRNLAKIARAALASLQGKDGGGS